MEAEIGDFQLPRLSLRVKVSLLIVIPILIVLAVSTYVAYHNQRARTLASMSLLASQTGEVIETALQRDMLASDFVGIQHTLDSIASDGRIRTLLLLDTSGKIVFAPQELGVGERLDNRSESCQPCHAYEPSSRPSGVVVSLEDGSSVFRSMHPIENQPSCTGCHPAEQRLIGLLLTDFSIAPIESAIAADLQMNLAWWVGTVILTALLAGFAVDRWVLSRLNHLTGAMETIGRDGPIAKLPEGPPDEIGRLSAAFNDMAAKVTRRERENAKLSQALQRRVAERGQLLERLIAAQEQERMRVARELHDELGQELTSTALTIQSAQQELDRDPALASTYLERAHDLIGDATDRMDDLIMGLRPSLLDDLGLIPALRAHARRVLDGTPIVCTIKAVGLDERLPEAIETALFRIFQEALTNTLKHARAQRVTIRLQRENGVVQGEIEDDGIGFDIQSLRVQASQDYGLGLIGMQERVDQLNGELAIHTTPGGGTRIRVLLELDGKADG